MVLKAYKEKTFKAEIKFEDGSSKGVTCRLPRNTDFYSSADGNKNVDNLLTFANMVKPFDTPVQVEIEDGSIRNVDNVRALIDLGVVVDLTDVVEKWFEKNKEVEEEKARLVKKSKSAGNSTQKDMEKAKD